MKNTEYKLISTDDFTFYIVLVDDESIVRTEEFKRIKSEGSAFLVLKFYIKENGREPIGLLADEQQGNAVYVLDDLAEMVERAGSAGFSQADKGVINRHESLLNIELERSLTHAERMELDCLRKCLVAESDTSWLFVYEVAGRCCIEVGYRTVDGPQEIESFAHVIDDRMKFARMVREVRDSLIERVNQNG